MWSGVTPDDWDQCHWTLTLVSKLLLRLRCSSCACALYPVRSGDEWQMVEICGGNTSITLPNKVWRVNISHERLMWRVSHRGHNQPDSPPVWLKWSDFWHKLLTHPILSKAKIFFIDYRHLLINVAQQLSFANIMAVNNSCWEWQLWGGPHRHYVIVPACNATSRRSTRRKILKNASIHWAGQARWWWGCLTQLTFVTLELIADIVMM